MHEGDSLREDNLWCRTKNPSSTLRLNTSTRIVSRIHASDLKLPEQKTGREWQGKSTEQAINEPKCPGAVEPSLNGFARATAGVISIP